VKQGGRGAGMHEGREKMRHKPGKTLVQYRERREGSAPSTPAGYALQGHLAHKKLPPPPGPTYDPRYSPTVRSRRGLFRMREVPL
jgi:hypothetical protein